MLNCDTTSRENLSGPKKATEKKCQVFKMDGLGSLGCAVFQDCSIADVNLPDKCMHA